MAKTTKSSKMKAPELGPWVSEMSCWQRRRFGTGQVLARVLPVHGTPNWTWMVWSSDEVHDADHTGEAVGREEAQRQADLVFGVRS